MKKCCSPIRIFVEWEEQRGIKSRSDILYGVLWSWLLFVYLNRTCRRRVVCVCFFFLMTTRRVIETEYDLLVRWCHHFSACLNQLGYAGFDCEDYWAEKKIETSTVRYQTDLSFVRHWENERTSSSICKHKSTRDVWM